MADPIDATPGGASSNSYCTVSAAIAYCEIHPDGATFIAATTSTQSAYCQYATKMLDYWVEWNGSKVDEAQALRWPRYGMQTVDGDYIDYNEIPVFLVEATAELARHLLTNGDYTGAPDTAGFKEMQVGSLKLVVDTEDRDAYGGFPDAVTAMVEPYGVVRDKGGASVVTLVRA